MVMSDTPRKVEPVVIPRPVDYFELGVFVFCVLYGAISLAQYSQVAATSVKLYPGWGGVAFLALLVAGGATGLVSYLFKTIKGPRLELAGLTLLVLLCIAYALWTPFSVGLRGIGLMLSMTTLIAVPGYCTVRRLRKYISDVEAIARNHS